MTVDIAPMADANHYDQKHVVLDPVEHAVGAYANAIETLATAELFHAARPRVLLQVQNVTVYAPQDIPGQGFEVAARGPRQLDPIRHGSRLAIETKLATDSLVGNPFFRFFQSSHRGIEIGTVFQLSQTSQTIHGNQGGDIFTTTVENDRLATLGNLVESVWEVLLGFYCVESNHFSRPSYSSILSQEAPEIKRSHASRQWAAGTGRAWSVIVSASSNRGARRDKVRARRGDSMEQERGCGWGCGLVLLLVAMVVLCIFVPFIGLPVAMLLAIAGVVAVLVRRERQDEPSESTPEAEE